MSERAAFAIVVVVSIVAALPVLWSPYPIAQDLPAHVETAAQLAALWQGDGDASARLVAHTPPWPNSLPTALLAGALVVVVPSADDPVAAGLTAGRAVFAVGVMLWPIALALLARRLGRTALLGLIALPTAFDLAFSYGFFHFTVGKPLFALTLACAVDVARGVRPRALLALCMVALFHTHLLLFVVAVPLSAAAIALFTPPDMRRWPHTLALVVGCAPGAWWLATHQGARGTSTFAPVPEALASLWANLGDLGPGHADVIPWALCACAAMVLVVSARDARVGDRRALLFSVGAGASVLAFAILGPIRTPAASVVAERFTAVGVGLLACALPTAVVGRARAGVVVVLGAIAALSTAAEHNARFAHFQNDEMGAFTALVAEVPRGGVIATHYAAAPLSPNGRHNALWHWPKLTALRGAITDDTFALRDTCVVVTKPGAWPAHPLLSRGFSAGGLRSFTHVLQWGEDRRADRAARDGQLERVGTAGKWTLWRVQPTPAQ